MMSVWYDRYGEVRERNDSRIPAGWHRYASRFCHLIADPRCCVAVVSQALDPQEGARHLVVVVEGQIDNANDLWKGVRNQHVARSNAMLLAMLYSEGRRRWHGQLHGTFRAVLVSELDAEMICLVDFACSKRLWWRSQRREIRVASDLVLLYEASESMVPCQEYLLRRVISGWTGRRHGPFVGTQRLSAGEALFVTAGVRTDRYWCPSAFAPKREAVQSHGSCLEEFASLLRGGVAASLPSSGPVLCELSGGLDSTTIATLAGELLAGQDGRVLHTMTSTYPGAARTDESKWAREVADRAHARHHEVPRTADAPIFGGMPDSVCFWDEPVFNVHSHELACVKEVFLAECGGEVVLNGIGAEIVLCEHMMWPVHLADSLARGRLGEVLSGLSEWRASRGLSIPLLVYRTCIAPFMNPQAAIVQEATIQAPPWTPTAARARFRELAIPSDVPVSRSNIGGAWLAEQWGATSSISDLGYAAFAFETRFPFLNRELVEGVLQMPWDVRVSSRTNKPLLRALAARILPEGVATKKSLPADHAIGRALARQRESVRRAISAQSLAQLGLVDSPALWAALDMTERGFGRGLRALLTYFAAELWLTAVINGDWRRNQHRRWDALVGRDNVAAASV